MCRRTFAFDSYIYIAGIKKNTTSYGICKLSFLQVIYDPALKEIFYLVSPFDLIQDFQ